MSLDIEAAKKELSFSEDGLRSCLKGLGITAVLTIFGLIAEDELTPGGFRTAIVMIGAFAGIGFLCALFYRLNGRCGLSDPKTS